MTVCIAAICRYGAGRAVLLTADRMISANDGEIQYEPNQMKFVAVTNRVVVLIAGNYSVHSEAIQSTMKHLAITPTADVREIAELYGSFVAEYRLREAGHLYLKPLGLSVDALANGGGGQLSSELASQMQNHHLKVEAIVAGHDGNAAHIYYIDQSGFSSCHDDTGFVAIGLGAPHVESHFRTSKYSNGWSFADCLLLSFFAKRLAERAAGVGPTTDMVVVSDQNAQEVLTEIRQKVEELHMARVEREQRDIGEDRSALATHIVELSKKFAAEAAAEAQAAKEANSSKDQT